MASSPRRIGGLVLVVLGLVLLLLGALSLLASFTSDSMRDARRVWMAFAALPLLALGGVFLQPGPVACRQCGAGGRAGAHFCTACGSALD